MKILWTCLLLIEQNSRICNNVTFNYLVIDYLIYNLFKMCDTEIMYPLNVITFCVYSGFR